MLHYNKMYYNAIKKCEKRKKHSTEYSLPKVNPLKL